ncbi:MAG: type II toxin-antitoxin system RelE/ParE family toxin [Planctomycetota bacterium]
MTLRIVPPAEAELTEGILYYEAQRPGLGVEFAREVKAAIRQIVQFPNAWQVVAQDARSCRTKRFPYQIIYLARGETIHILAIIHAQRHPRRWQDRLRELE